MSSRRDGYNVHLRNLASGIEDEPPATTRRRRRQETEEGNVERAPDGNIKYGALVMNFLIEFYNRILNLK